jgi:PIN domain nuclease of toxin-antitoxin system
LVEALEALRLRIHLDTHVAVWLRAGDTRRLRAVRKTLASGELRLSPFVVLELQFLYEIGRLRENGREISEHLRLDHEVEVEEQFLAPAGLRALDLSFARDPFDRLIAGHALAADATLLSADEKLLRHVSCARWS